MSKKVLSKKKQALNIKHRTLFKDLLNKTKQKLQKFQQIIFAYLKLLKLNANHCRALCRCNLGIALHSFFQMYSLCTVAVLYRNWLSLLAIHLGFAQCCNASSSSSTLLLVHQNFFLFPICHHRRLHNHPHHHHHQPATH